MVPISRFTKLIAILLALVFLQPNFPVAAATTASDCKIDREGTVENSPVSVGFPIHPDRYVGRTEVNVLVASFELKDVKFTKKLESFKDRDIFTTKLVSRLSRNKVKINFIYTDKVFTYGKTLKEWEELKAGQHDAYGRQDESKSTWGFVREAISWFDKDLDFSKIDSFVLQGPFDSKVASEEKTAVYEAFMTRTEAKGFFRPFAANEKNILNAFVMSGTFEWLSYAHELLHNFGLTDLYDSTGKEPEPLAYKWSLFSSGNPTLFYWERWQLGWIDDSEVLCIDLRNSQVVEPRAVTLNYQSSTEYKMIVLRLDAKTAYAIELREPILLEQYETSDRWKDISGQALLTYSVKSNRWPAPIRMVNQPPQVVQDDLTVGKVRNLGSYQVEVFDAEIGRTVVGLWSESFASSQKVSEIRTSAVEKRDARLAILKAQADAKIAEEKAKQEAEAAEAKAKLEASNKAPINQNLLKSNKQSSKKITITCTKGSISRKVIGINPKCPSGFKKKS